MDFAENLKYLRYTRQFTQKKLANILGLSPNCVCEWEKRRSEPSISTLKKIADLFEVSTDYLLGLEDDFGARTVAPMSVTSSRSELSEEEKQIIEKYRSLPEQLKKLVRDQLAVFTEPSTIKNT